MMIEREFEDDLRMLVNALKSVSFRFILIGHNHRSLFLDIRDWLRHSFPVRPFLELSISDKNYRSISNALQEFERGIVLIPDFDWFFRHGNESICIAFNQRRDYYARRDIAFICFIQPGSFISVAKKMPDWWSLRSLELNFHRDILIPQDVFQQINEEGDSFGGATKQEKEEELLRLLSQIEKTDSENKTLLINLYGQVGRVLYSFGRYEEALSFFEKSLALIRQVSDIKNEGGILNYISQISYSRGDYDTALAYLQQSLKIQQETGDGKGEGVTLSNIGLIYDAKGDYDTALGYLQQSLKIRQEIGDRRGEGTTLNNIGQIYSAKGDYDTALGYLQQGLKVAQEIGDRRNEGGLLNNISQIHKVRGGYDTALGYLQQSLKITQEIGDRRGEGTTLNNISQIYDAKGDYDVALGYLQQSLKIAHEIGDINGAAITMTNMGSLLFRGARFEEALPLFMQAYNIFKQIGSPNASTPESYLNAIIEKIGRERYEAILKGQ